MRALRWPIGLILLGLVGLVVFEPQPPVEDVPPSADCFSARITGYVRSEFSAHTYDGTSVYSDEPFIAASWDIPIDAWIWIEDLGTFRVADRGGGLGNGYPLSWLDVPVWTRAEAYALTGTRRACRVG